MRIIRDLTTHPEPFITVAELARYWHVSQRTVYRHIEKGALPITRVGPFRRVRVRVSDAILYGRPDKQDCAC